MSNIQPIGLASSKAINRAVIGWVDVQQGELAQTTSYIVDKETLTVIQWLTFSSDPEKHHMCLVLLSRCSRIFLQ